LLEVSKFSLFLPFILHQSIQN